MSQKSFLVFSIRLYNGHIIFVILMKMFDFQIQCIFIFYIYIKQFINSHFSMYFFMIDCNLAFKIHVCKVLKKGDFAL